MALFTRRIALLAATTATAVVGSLAMPATMAAAADPITTLAPPTLTAPANETSTPVKNVILTWDASSAVLQYASGYQVQISPNQDWTNNTVTLPNGGVTSNLSYEAPISLPHDAYYWRVRAVDAGGHTAWSAVHAFLHDWVAPMTELQDPTGAVPTVSWAPVRGASLYRVRFSTQSDFPTDPGLTATCWTAQTTFTPYTLASAGDKINEPCMSATDIKDGVQLFWDVRAFDDSAAPIMASDTANDPSWDCAQAQPECDADHLFSGTFTWIAPTAGTVAAGPVTGLTTTWHADTATQNACDNSDTLFCPVTPTFSWNSVGGANYYRVTVYRDPALTNVYRVFDTQWPTITPRDAFLDAQAGNGFYWTVAAGTCTNSNVDPTCRTPVLTGVAATGAGGGGGGTPTAAKPTIVFDDVSAGPAVFDKRSGVPHADASSPSGESAESVTLNPTAALVNRSTGTFTWTDFFDHGGRGAYDVRNYRLQIATDNSFDDVVLDVPTIDMTRYTPQAADLADGVYYWRVQPVDESGNGLTWSNVLSFTRDATPPVFRLTDTTNLPISGAKFHLVVSENQLIGTVSNSTVQIVPVVGGGAALAGSWATSATGWTFTAASKLVPGQSYAVKLIGGITDAAQNPAQADTHTARATTVADDAGGAWSFGSGAVRHSASGALGGTHVVLASGRSATVHLVGTKASVYGCKSPTLAKLIVKVDGTTVSTVNEHQSFTKCGVLLWSGSVSSTIVHTVVVTASGGQASIDQVRTA